jgi:hypothetical protein
MNMLNKTFPEGSRNQSSTDTHSSPILMNVGTVSDSAAGSASLDLDFLVGKTMKTRSSSTTSGPGGGGGDGGSRSSTSSDVLNGTLKTFQEFIL